MNPLETWIASLIAEQYRTAGTLAAKIGMSDSGLSRGAAKGTLSIEKLLHLARETGELPSAGLRRAGKDEIAALLDDLYGVPAAQLTKREARLLDTFRQVPKAGQDLMIQAGEVYRLAAATGRATADPT